MPDCTIVFATALLIGALIGLAGGLLGRCKL